MSAPGDVSLVALVRLTDVDHLDGVLLDKRLELVDADGLDPLWSLELEHVAGDVQQADGVEPARGLARVLGHRCVDRYGLVVIEHEARLGADRAALERHVQRAVCVPGRVCLSGTHVEELALRRAE